VAEAPLRPGAFVTGGAAELLTPEIVRGLSGATLLVSGRRDEAKLPAFSAALAVSGLAISVAAERTACWRACAATSSVFFAGAGLLAAA